MKKPRPANVNNIDFQSSTHQITYRSYRLRKNTYIGYLSALMIRRIHLFLLLILTQDLLAQENVFVQHLGIDRGLSNNAVTSIYQDHNGFMWFGTYDGLNQYDGYSFKVFRNIIGDSSSIGDNHIVAIAGDGNHNVWVGCEKGLYLYNSSQGKFSSPFFKTLKNESVISSGKFISQLCTIGNGDEVLASISGYGLIAFEKNSQKGVQVSLERTQGTAAYSVASFAVDSVRKVVWVWVDNVGLCQYDTKKKMLHPIALSTGGSGCMTIGADGRLWLGNAQGVFLYNEATKTFSENIMPARYRVMQVMEDRQRNLWIASDGGGVWTLPNGASHPIPYLSRKGTPLVNSNAVYALYEDADERKWIATLRGGINVIQPRTNSFTHINYNAADQPNENKNFILSFCEDLKGNLWVGTDGAGLRYWDRKTGQYIRYTHDAANINSISSDFVTGITRDSRNDLWIATWFGGVNRLKQGSTTFEHFRCFNTDTKAYEENAWLVYEDAQKRLWASCANNGALYLFNREVNQFELFDPTVMNLQCLAEDKAGQFWGGTYGGLIRIGRENKKNQRFAIGRTVRCIHEDKRKNFWVGTEGGGLLLFDREHGTYQQFTSSDGLPSNTILRILEDEKGDLWLSTYNGLCKFDPGSMIFKNFSQSDGLQSNQFSFNAGAALKSGEFVFGGINGFNIFHPDSVGDKKEMPPVFLTGLRINNSPTNNISSYIARRELEKVVQINLPYDQAILSLDFVALAYSGADKIKYAYFLAGWDKGWNYANNSRTANYSRLQEGTYVFKVKVANADGVWGDETRLLTVVVTPPWYRTWWAYFMYALVVFGGGYLYLLYSKRQERLRYEVKLAHLEKEKEKESTERKISFFTHISHEFRTPLTLIINPLKDLASAKGDSPEKTSILKIYRNARRLLSLVDQLLLFRKVESVDQQLRLERFDIVDVCREIVLSFSHLAQSRKIDFVFEDNGNKTLIYGDKEKIEIILYNLVSNAFKYTPAGGKVTLLTEEQGDEVHVLVKDSGTGIPAEIGDKIFDSFYRVENGTRVAQTGFGIGLYVSQKLAAAHHGRIVHQNLPGGGAEFRLILPKEKDPAPLPYIKEDVAEKTHPTILQELVEEPELEVEAASPAVQPNRSQVIDKLTSDLPSLLVIDDNPEIRSYIKEIFSDSYIIYEAEDGPEGYELAAREVPDIVICDVRMKKMDGVEVCRKIKQTPSIAHIPVLLLTASSSDETKLQGLEEGAEDYISKPFDRSMIVARVQNILKGRNHLQQYFFNAVTLKPTVKVAGEHKEFVERCIMVVEEYLDDSDFTVEKFCKRMGMSHPALYKKVRSVSGLTVNVFIRYIRLRKAAELLITTNKTITEVAYMTGFTDVRYFREQFFGLFQIKPSDYVKRYRRVLGKNPTG